MEISYAKEKDSRMRGEDQHLTKAVASVFLLPGFKECIPKVSPSIRILRVSLEHRSECGDGLFDVFLFSFCYQSPRTPYERSVIAQKELAKKRVDLFMALQEALGERPSQTGGSQDCPEGEGQCSQTGTLIHQPIFSVEH